MPEIVIKGSVETPWYSIFTDPSGSTSKGIKIPHFDSMTCGAQRNEIHGLLPSPGWETRL
jgi:hypothetical protein